MDTLLRDKIISEKDANLIFGNIDDLLDFHVKLLADLDAVFNPRNGLFYSPLVKISALCKCFDLLQASFPPFSISKNISISY